eukprot:363354-Chlamydomonas_euryale.AAC.5
MPSHLLVSCRLSAAASTGGSILKPACCSALCTSDVDSWPDRSESNEVVQARELLQVQSTLAARVECPARASSMHFSAAMRTAEPACTMRPVPCTMQFQPSQCALRHALRAMRSCPCAMQFWPLCAMHREVCVMTCVPCIGKFAS